MNISKSRVVPALLLALVIAQAQQSPPQTEGFPAPIVIHSAAPAASNNYPLTADSEQQPGVPAGTTLHFAMTGSRFFPGTTRTITVYVPAQYKADKPACLYVGFDGLGFKAATVFDNLIAQHAIPVIIGIGIEPGTVASAHPPADPRFDRSFEFDTMSDRLVRFVDEEVIPEAEKQETADGRRISISKDPNCRSIGGASTGAIAAFTAAWQRPDSFRRVFSAIGTYVGMRGGESYYVSVRKTESKPIRIFMQDGIHDEWMGGPEMGDWWMSNQTMERALEFAGYDVRHVWGVGTHNDQQATALFPEAMRWLWRDWPAPIKPGASSNPVLKAILQAGEEWQDAGGCCPSAHLAANSSGEVFWNSGGLNRLGAGSDCHIAPMAFAFAADGRPHKADELNPLLPTGRRIQDLTVRNNGDLYATAKTTDGDGELWYLPKNGAAVRLDRALIQPSGLAFSPDGLWLFVAQAGSKFGISYRVQEDGKLDAREPFYQFDVAATQDTSGATQVAMDRDGRAYVATAIGVQIFDRNGRVTAILPLPGGAAATGLCFGDGDFRTLYVAAGSKVFKRRLAVAGAPPWAAPFALPEWSAG